MARRCSLTGKRPNIAHKVSHSNIKTKKRQLPNIQKRSLWHPPRSQHAQRSCALCCNGLTSRVGQSLLHTLARAL